MIMLRAVPLLFGVALVASPLVVHAETDYYGSLRIGIGYSDPGGSADATATFKNWASRAGVTSEAALENGLTAFGKLEFGVDTGSSANDNGSLSTRLAYIGLKGDFGSLTLGQAYHSFYNTVISPVDQTWWGGCAGCLAYSGRVENGLTYSRDFGAFSATATIHMRDETVDGSFEDEIDGMEAGVSFAAAGIDLGLAFRDWDDGSEPAVGLSAASTFGDISYAANLILQEGAQGADDAMGANLHLGRGNAYLDVGMVDAGDTSTGITLGYTHSIGKNTSSWFEVSRNDSGVDGDAASMALRAALKYDWK